MGFLSLIKPLNWAFPTIYSLPENCLEMLSSPLPIISGIKCDYNYAKKHILNQYSNDDSVGLIFVFLDEDYILTSKKIINETYVPNFNNSFKELKFNYSHFFKKENPKTVKIDFSHRRFKAKSKSFKAKKKEDFRVNLDQDEVLIFLNQMRDIITAYLIDVLPQTLEDNEEVSSIFLIYFSFSVQKEQ